MSREGDMLYLIILTIGLIMAGVGSLVVYGKWIGPIISMLLISIGWITFYLKYKPTKI